MKETAVVRALKKLKEMFVGLEDGEALSDVISEAVGLCPLCGSREVDYQGNDAEACGDEITYKVKCIDCGAEFEEVFEVKYLFTRVNRFVVSGPSK